MEREIIIFYFNKKYKKIPYTTLNDLGDELDKMLMDDNLEQITIRRKEE